MHVGVASRFSDSELCWGLSAALCCAHCAFCIAATGGVCATSITCLYNTPITFTADRCPMLPTSATSPQSPRQRHSHSLQTHLVHSFPCSTPTSHPQHPLPSPLPPPPKAHLASQCKTLPPDILSTMLRLTPPPLLGVAGASTRGTDAADARQHACTAGQHPLCPPPPLSGPQANPNCCASLLLTRCAPFDCRLPPCCPPLPTIS